MGATVKCVDCKFNLICHAGRIDAAGTVELCPRCRRLVVTAYRDPEKEEMLMGEYPVTAIEEHAGRKTFLRTKIIIAYYAFRCELRPWDNVKELVWQTKLKESNAVNWRESNVRILNDTMGVRQQASAKTVAQFRIPDPGPGMANETNELMVRMCWPCNQQVQPPEHTIRLSAVEEELTVTDLDELARVREESEPSAFQLAGTRRRLPR